MTPSRDPEAVQRDFRARMEDPDLFPERLTLELSFDCNLRCPVCPRHDVSEAGLPNPGMMDAALARRLLDEAAGGGATILVPFFRGESLLHPDFAGIIRHARKVGFQEVQLATNATLLEEAVIEDLIACGVTFLSLSLDAADPDAYEAKRLNADYGDTVKKVERLLKRIEESGAVIETQVSAVDDAMTPEEKQALVDFWGARVDRIRIYPAHSGDGWFGSLPEGVMGEKIAPRLPCLKPLTDLVVYSDGRVAHCNHDWDHPGDRPLGSAHDRSLGEIFRGAAYKRLREWHLDPRPEGETTCYHCDHWQAYYQDDRVMGELHPGKP